MKYFSVQLKSRYCNCFLFLFLCIQVNMSGQITHYTIESFQGEYDELTSYQSVALLTDFDPFWWYEFELDFPFPFYDSTYTRMIYNHASWGGFTEDQDEALLLMDCGAFSIDHHAIDTSNITSDVRFSHVMDGDMQAFVIQFTKARFFDDPFIDSLDTYINFQLRFYENGFMEVHFGSTNIDESPIYMPGKGFYGYSDTGFIDTTQISGPHMGIEHPITEDNAFGLEGAYNDYEVVNTNYSTLTVLPPEGWVIRFKPSVVSTFSPGQEVEHLVISPNPANEYINFPITNEKIIVLNGTGSVVFEGYPKYDALDVSFLPSGLYYLQIISEEKISIGKFLRQ